MARYAVEQDFGYLTVTREEMIQGNDKTNVYALL
jgi:hypothetical protein